MTILGFALFLLCIVAVAAVAYWLITKFAPAPRPAVGPRIRWPSALAGAALAVLPWGHRVPSLAMTDEAPAVKEAISIVRNRRSDAMFVAAYVAIAVLVYIVVYEEKIGEYAQSTVTLVLGMFLNELKNMYNYEQGTTRSSEQKGAAITRIAESTPTTTAAAVAATVAATAAATPGTAIPLIPVEAPAVPPTTGAPQ